MTSGNLEALKKVTEKHKKEETETASASRQEEHAGGFKAAMSKYLHTQQTDADRQAEHDALMEECARVDLLALVQQETGETGRSTGDRVRFNLNPITGTHDDFDVYPADNTWCSYSDSMSDYRRNGKDFAGGNVLDYLEAKHHGDKTLAVKELHDLSGVPFDPNRESRTRNAGSGSTQDDSQAESDKPILPPWVSVMATEPPKRNAVLIDGLLRRGHVALLAAKGKSGKSWSAIQLACAVATGGEWFGYGCEQGDTLYLDPEIDRKSLDNRFAAVCKSMQVSPAEIDSHVSKWPLRGVGNATIGNVIHDLKLSCTAGQFALVVIDSASVFVEGDENSSVDIRRFSASVLQIAAITGASVLLVHHYGKGGAGDRETADRARGSSVWLDFPDCTLFLTETFPPKGKPSDYLLDGERAFLLETGGLREFPSPKPRRLVFAYPAHRVDVDGVTDGWKPKSGQHDGGKKAAELKKAQAEAKAAATESALLAHYYSEGIGGDGLIIKEAAEAVGMDSRQLTAALEGSKHFDVVQVTQRKRYVRPKKEPRVSPQELPLQAE